MSLLEDIRRNNRSPQLYYYLNNKTYLSPSHDTTYYLLDNFITMLIIKLISHSLTMVLRELVQNNDEARRKCKESHILQKINQPILYYYKNYLMFSILCFFVFDMPILRVYVIITGFVTEIVTHVMDKHVINYIGSIPKNNPIQSKHEIIPCARIFNASYHVRYG